MELKEKNVIQDLYHKWWAKNVTCDEHERDALTLGMDNVGGVFIVLIVGIAISIIIGILEFLWNIRKVSIDEKVVE